ncbi:MAG: U32 family peptidase C-terminal domain-containing protein, partial [Clostridiales bacterium]|nr:U32 family peptidase C-terminal domain-containing protein [Clostridiales bacterium]
IEVRVNRIAGEDGADMESAPHPKQTLFIDLGHPMEEFDVLRRKERT